MSSPIRVVIADDSDDIRRMLRIALDLEGDFEVVAEADDGEKAVAAVDRERPDVVVLDLAMPVMDGLQAITLVRERSPLTRIVVLSGFNAAKMAAEARALGADEYLEKGTAFSDLAALLRKLHTQNDVRGPSAPVPVAADVDAPRPAATIGVDATGGIPSLAGSLVGAPDLATALERFAASLGDIARFDRVAFSVVTDDGRSLGVLATAGDAAWRLPVGSSVMLESEVLGLLGSGRPWAIADTAERRDLPSVSELCERGVRSFVSVPVVIGGRLQVVVSFASLTAGRLGPEQAPALAAAVEPVGAVLHVLATLDEEREAARRMRDLERLRSDFVGMVAHDLRSPMTVIAGFAEALERGWDLIDDAEKREFVARISRNIGNLTALVEDVLTVSHIESREFQLDVRPLDLAATVRQCVADLAEGVPDRAVVIDVPDDLPSVHGDAGRQRQVISNLVSNALKFSPSDEPVTVTARAVGSVIEVSVADHGLGIAPEDVPRLFERFFRTDEGKSYDRSGTGLGLYICKSLVESWDGEIRVESVVGDGSTFTYTTPVSEDSAAPSETPSPDPATALASPANR